MKHFFLMGHISNLLYYDYFQKKLEYHLWMHKWCFYRRRRYSSEAWCPLLPSRPLQLPPSGHRVLAPSLSCLPWAPTLGPGSVTVHANQQPAKHLCPSLGKGHIWWCLISIDSLCISTVYCNITEGHQNKVRSGCFCHSSLSQSQEDVGDGLSGLSRLDGTCARNRTFLG